MLKSPPRFLFDEDLLGVGVLVQRAREHARDVWVIGRDPCPIKKATPDEKWLPIAAQHRLVVFRIDNDLLTPGSAIHKKWHELGCRGFVLNIQQSKSSVWRQLQALIRYWDKIEEHALSRTNDPSWIARLNSAGIRPE